MLVFSFDGIQILNLNEPDDDGNNHHSVYDSIIGVDDHDGHELVVCLTDQGEVEDEGDGEGDQREETQEESNLRVGPV